MQTPIPVYNCPTRERRVVRQQDGSAVTEGIGADYGVNYGSGTSSAENNDGAFEFSCGDCGIGKQLLDLRDGTSNTLLIGEKHVTRAGIGRFDAETGADHDFNIYSSQPSRWASNGSSGPSSPRPAGARRAASPGRPVLAAPRAS